MMTQRTVPRAVAIPPEAETPSRSEESSWVSPRYQSVPRLGRRSLPLAVLILALGASACHSSEDETETEAVVKVKVAAVERKDVASNVTAVGTVTPKYEAVVSPKVGAPVADMGILKDRFVRAGDTIAVLESRDLGASAAEADASVREAEATARQTSGGTNPQGTAQKEKALRDAEARLRGAEALYRRRKMLFDQGGIPKKELEDAEIQLDQARNERELAQREVTLAASNLNPTNAQIAESRLQQARGRAANAHAQLDYAVVRSPIAGVITEQFHQKGDFVAAGEKLVTVADISEVIVKAQFPDTDVADVQVGANAQLLPSSGQDEPLFGTVQLVSRTVDPASRTVEVWVRAANEGNRLRPGEFTKVTIVTEEASEAITVPPSAVTFDDPTEDKGKVMVVDDASVAHEVEVTVGVRGDDAYEITEGLHENENVIVEGNYALPDGTKVSTVEEEEGDEADEEEGEHEEGEAGSESPTPKAEP
jgi:HlyD family secretion protein